MTVRPSQLAAALAVLASSGSALAQSVPASFISDTDCLAASPSCACADAQFMEVYRAQQQKGRDTWVSVGTSFPASPAAALAAFQAGFTNDPRVSNQFATCPGYNPAVNVQMATDPESRAILGVDVTNEGADSSDLSAPMRQQVQERTGGEVKQHLIDGGYMKTEDIETAHDEGVELFVPPKPARSEAKRGHELEPKAGDNEAILAWKQRMSSGEGKEIYKQRASTSETVNADLRTHRGLGRILVRGLKKAKCVALWSALAYNIMHFSSALLNHRG